MRLNNQINTNTINQNNSRNPGFKSIVPSRIYINGILETDSNIIKTYITSLRRILNTFTKNNQRYMQLQEEFHKCVPDYLITSAGARKGSSCVHSHLDKDADIGYFFTGMHADTLNGINNSIRFENQPITKYSNQIKRYIESGGKLKNSDGDEVTISIFIENKLAKNGKILKDYEIKKVTTEPLIDDTPYVPKFAEPYLGNKLFDSDSNKNQKVLQPVVKNNDAIKTSRIIQQKEPEQLMLTDNNGPFSELTRKYDLSYKKSKRGR